MSEVIDEIINGSEKARRNLEKELGYGRLFFTCFCMSRKCYKVPQEALSQMQNRANIAASLLMASGAPCYVFGKQHPKETELVFFLVVLAISFYYYLTKRSSLKNSRIVYLEQRPIRLYLRKLSQTLSLRAKGFLLFANFTMIVGTLYASHSLVKLGFLLVPILFSVAIIFMVCTFVCYLIVFLYSYI